MFIRRENTKTEYLFVSCTLTYPKLRSVLKFKKFKRFKMKKMYFKLCELPAIPPGVARF